MEITIHINRVGKHDCEYPWHWTVCIDDTDEGTNYERTEKSAIAQAMFFITENV